MALRVCGLDDVGAQEILTKSVISIHLNFMHKYLHRARRQTRADRDHLRYPDHETTAPILLRGKLSGYAALHRPRVGCGSNRASQSIC